MEKIIEIVLDCSECEGLIVLHISESSQIKEMFEPCAVCKVMLKVA